MTKLKEYKETIESLTKENERLKKMTDAHVKKEELLDSNDLDVPSTSSFQPIVKAEVKREKKGLFEYVETQDDEIVLD